MQKKKKNRKQDNAGNANIETPADSHEFANVSTSFEISDDLTYV